MEIPDILKNKWVQTAAISIVTFAGGAGLGYIFGKRKVELTLFEHEEHGLKIQELRQELNDLLDKDQKSAETELETAYIKYNKDPDFEKLLDDEEKDIERKRKERNQLRQEMLATREAEELFERNSKVEEPQRVNVFVNRESDWNYEAELATREREAPYVLHQDEFINDEMGFHQATLTYYKGDDIMADTDDTPIYNYEGLMGELKFGHGTTDPNIVYIRNEVIHMEWEILLHQGSFEQEVLGLEMEEEDEKELRHSIQKFRSD